MTHIERSIHIAAPPEPVFELLTDLDRLSSWATIAGRLADPPEAPLREGTAWQHEITIAGVSLDSEWTVDRYDPPNEVAYRATTAGGGRLEMTQRVAGDEGGSTVDIVVDYDLPGGFVGKVADAAGLERVNEREAERTLENLRGLIEGGG